MLLSYFPFFFTIHTPLKFFWYFFASMTVLGRGGLIVSLATRLHRHVAIILHCSFRHAIKFMTFKRAIKKWWKLLDDEATLHGCEVSSWLYIMDYKGALQSPKECCFGGLQLKFMDSNSQPSGHHTGRCSAQYTYAEITRVDPPKLGEKNFEHRHNHHLSLSSNRRKWCRRNKGEGHVVSRSIVHVCL